MIKKFSLGIVLIITISLLNVNQGYSQSKTPAVKKNASLNKPVTINKNSDENPVVSDKKDESIRVKITTDSGIMIVKLYDSTPLHRDNFVKLVKAGFYDSLLFHRVIPGFMIQGGDPLSKNAIAGDMLGNGGSDMERIPAEFKPDLFHKKGVLAAARDGNPQKASSACQFYIVEGNILNDIQLNSFEQNKGIKYTPAQRNIYKMIGGTAMLDMEYTVFGEVESGLEVIHKIANVKRDPRNRPMVDSRMYIEIMK